MDNCIKTEKYRPTGFSNFSLGSAETVSFSNSQIKLLSEIRKIVYPNGRSKFDLDDDDLKLLMDSFIDWVEEPLYIVFKNESGRYEFHKAMKRGNNVYQYKLQSRIDSATKFFDTDDFKTRFMLRQNNRRFLSNVLFITLTWDTNIFLGNRHKAWLLVKEFYNVYITQLRQKFGKIWVMMTVESTEKGNPHIHLILITKTPFNCFNYNGKWRINNKSDLEKWSSFVDVSVPTNVGSLKAYLTKDMFKQFLHTVKNDKDYLSLALTWFYKIRSIAISNDGLAHEFIYALSLTQITLMSQISDLAPKNSVFLGLVRIYPFVDGKPPPDSFTTELNDRQIDELNSCLIKRPEVMKNDY